MPEVNDKAILAQLTGDPQAGLQALLDSYVGMIYAIVRRILPGQAPECFFARAQSLMERRRNDASELAFAQLLRY